MSEPCSACGAPLCPDEIALTKKLINRGATSYFCLDCLASKFAVDTETLTRKIAEFREAGCTLFSQEKDAHVK